MTLEVFISYAHQDQQFRNELDKHLSNLRRQGIISSWYDGDIAPGTEWRRQVMNHLDTAQIILLLISADFMASDFCYSIEMTRALERHRANEARVLPIILRPTDWRDAPFAALKVLPTDGKAVTRWPTLDDAFENVIQGIRRAIQEMAEENERAVRRDRVSQRFGDYWLRRRLGGGSFGDVYLGEHVHTHSLAAVKVLHVRLTRSEELRAFINEVRTFRLQHPHIVRLLDVGIAPDEAPFLVMQYASNGTLRDRHPTGSRVSLSTILSYVVPIASALQYAHDQHVVHRDIKPENMLLGAEGELWLSDFGIATVAHSTGSLTTEGMGGTLPYMAPEQILGKPRAQSDQYALAIVVYEWLSGTRPFQGTPPEIAVQHQMAPPPALRTQVPTLPAEVEQVVLTALSKDPKDRFGNVQAFATALVQAAQAPLEQSVPSQRSQGTPFTIESEGREVVAEVAEAEQQQASSSDLTEPQTTDGFPPPSTANNISEGFAKPGTLPVSELPATTEDASPPIASDVPGIVSTAQPVVPSKPGISRGAEASPPPLEQDGAEPTAPVSLPDAELPADEDQRVPPARPEAPGELEPTSPAPHTSESAPTIPATDAPSLPSPPLSPPTPGPTKRRLSPSEAVSLILLALILLGGISFGIYHAVTGIHADLSAVAWSGSQFVAVGYGAAPGYNGTILTSPNGRTWTTQNIGTSYAIDYLEGVAWSGSQFVAVGGAILTSPNGRTWTTQQNYSSPGLLFGVIWSDSQFVAVGYNGTILTSPDGSTWTTQTSGTSQILEGVTWSGSRFVAVGLGGTILTSPDGSIWTTQNPGTSHASDYLEGVAWSGSQFVAVGFGAAPGYNGTILTSPDGRTWTTQNIGTSQSLNSVAWSGSQFVAVGSEGTILTSPDGSTWTTQTSGTSSFLKGVAWSGSQFVAVGDGGTILTSPDGHTWST